MLRYLRKTKIKATWNNHKGLRRLFSFDQCEEMCGDGYYYRAVTVFGLSFVALNI